MIRKLIVTVLVGTGALFMAVCQESGAVLVPDSGKVKAAPVQAPAAQQDAIVLRPKIAAYNYDAIPKDPLASLLLSAVLPGSGQIFDKEYGRGIVNGVVCYGSIVGIMLLVDKWYRINTDTIHLAEADPVTGLPNGNSRDVYVMRDPDKQVGLPAGDKALLVGCIALALTSYVYGMIDSYRGAQRYNKKLLESQQIKLGLIADPVDGRIGVAAKFRF
jgi:hypothetical protein